MTEKDRKTVTRVFLVPTLQVPIEVLESHGYINGYVRDVGREVHYEDCVYLLFKPKDMEKFREFLEKEYARTKWIIEDYDYPDGYVVVVYSLDPDYKKDYDLVRKGKYSKTSREFQNLFPQIIKVTIDGIEMEKVSMQFRVFNKTEDLIQHWEDKFGVEFDNTMEVWTTFEEDKETLDIEKLKKHDRTTTGAS